MNTSKKIISLLMCMLMVLSIVPIMPGAVIEVHAAGTTQVTLTMSDDTVIALSLQKQYYNASTKTSESSGTLDGTTHTAYLNNSGELELYNFSGKRISVNYANLASADLIIKLKGTNTLSITDGEFTSAIYNDEDGDIRIYADDDASLNITVSGSSSSVSGISTSVQQNVYNRDVIIGGKAKVTANVTATDDNKALGIYAYKGAVSILDDAHFSATVSSAQNYYACAIYANSGVTVNTTGDISVNAYPNNNLWSFYNIYSASGYNTLTKVGTMTNTFFGVIGVSDASPAWTYDANTITLTSTDGADNKQTRVYTYGVPTTYMVSFDSNGGSYVEPQSIVEGQKASEPTVPTKEGFEFKGWFLDGASYDFDTPVNGSITLVANWEAKANANKINSTEIFVSAPIVGQSPDHTVELPSGVSYEVTNKSGIVSIGWYANSITGTQLSSSYKFNKYDKYIVGVRLSPKAEYEFDNPSAKVNGNAAQVMSAGDDILGIYEFG